MTYFFVNLILREYLWASRDGVFTPFQTFSVDVHGYILSVKEFEKVFNGINISLINGLPSFSSEHFGRSAIASALAVFIKS